MASSLANGRFQAIQLGADLRELRKHAGKTVMQVAETLGMHHSTVSRWERGENMPDEADTSALLTVYGIIGEDRDRVLDLARQVKISDWVAPGIGRQLAAFIEYERRAERIIEVNPLLIPGLLQTRDYTWSLMIGAGLPQDQAETDTTIRVRRQSLLTGRRPPQLIAVVGEQAVRYPPSDDAVMVGQLRHLLAVGKLPNVEVRILPMDRRYSIALEGRFILLEFTRERPVVQVDSYCSTSTLTNPRAVSNYRDAADAIRAATLSADESAAYIANLAKEVEVRS